MNNLKRWTIPVASFGGLLAFLLTYSLARTQAAPPHPPSPPSIRESTLLSLAGTLARSERPSSLVQIRPKEPEPSRTLHEAQVHPKETPGGHGPLGYLRDIPPCSGEAGQTEVIRRTAERLGVPEGSREDFEKAAVLALSEMKEASQLQFEEAQVLGLFSPGSRKGAPSEASPQLQERYAARRAGALGRLEPYLGDSPAAGEFRATFEAWVATVRLKGREVR